MMTRHLYSFGFCLAIAIPAFVILFFVLKLIYHSRRVKRHPSGAGLIGMRGRAHSNIANDGLIVVRGELWPARSPKKIQRGETVLVKGFEGLVLKVEPV
jgi:membrane-bound ClpP family serine protease